MNHEHKEAYLRLQGYEPVRWSFYLEGIGVIRNHGWYNKALDFGFGVTKMQYGKERHIFTFTASKEVESGWAFEPWGISIQSTNAVYRELIAWENMDE